MKDQFGNEVPDDLVVIDSGQYADERAVEIIMACDWYECNGYIMASASKLDEALYCQPEDCDLELKEPIYRIADGLKRWGKYDGFYHA